MVWRRGFDVPPPLIEDARQNLVESVIQAHLQKSPSIYNRLKSELTKLYKSFEPIQNQLDYFRAKNFFSDLNHEQFSTFCKGMLGLFSGRSLTKEEAELIDTEGEYRHVRGECLKDTILRMKKWLRVEYLLWGQGDCILVVAHGNWMRGVIKMLDNLSNEQILAYNIPTASPILYELYGLDVISKEYLEDKETLRKRALSVFKQDK